MRVRSGSGEWQSEHFRPHPLRPAASSVRSEPLHPKHFLILNNYRLLGRIALIRAFPHVPPSKKSAHRAMALLISSFSGKFLKISVIIELPMVSFIKGIILMGMLGTLTAGCGRNLDLLKIVGKNIAYESRHPVQPPSSKLRAFPRDNPGIHVGWVGHSTVLLSFYGTLILTDPNFSHRIVIARRVVDLPIKPEEVKEWTLCSSPIPIMTIWMCRV